MNLPSIFVPRTVEVKDVFNGEEYAMTICVYPHPQTLYFSNLVRRADKENDIDAYAEALSILVPEWDIKLGRKAFPPTKENFLRVPREFADRVFEKAWEAVEAAQPKITIIEGEPKEEAKTAEAK